MSHLPDLRACDHRPWPLPRRPWAMRMEWHDLLFAHWSVPAGLLETHLPPGLDLDLFEGRAWLGVVPFRMSGVSPRGVPDLPGVSAFLELNVRTYVVAGGKPGVWFFSLDAASRLAVRVARTVFHLPYFDASIDLQRDGDEHHYTSVRTHRHAPAARLEVHYRPTGEPFLARPGTLEHWLTERYCLYATKGDRVWRGDIHHAPWPLQPAGAEFHANTMMQSLGLPLEEAPASLLFARSISVVGWRNQRVETARR